jgi:DHA2 family multidrug resistance protein
MIPTVFTSVLPLLPGSAPGVFGGRHRHHRLDRAHLGPVIGGWITDTLNWHWLFYVNLLPGLAITALVPLLVRIDKPDLSLLRGADYPGIA